MDGCDGGAPAVFADYRVLRENLVFRPDAPGLRCGEENLQGRHRQDSAVVPPPAGHLRAPHLRGVGKRRSCGKTFSFSDVFPLFSPVKYSSENKLRKKNAT